MVPVALVKPKFVDEATVAKIAEVVAFPAMSVPIDVFPRVVEPVVKMLPAVR